MRRSHKDADITQIQRLQKENEKLKRRISALQKQLARIDLDSHNNVKELVDKFEQEDYKEEKHSTQKALEEKWKCHKCDEGVLKLILIQRKDKLVYFRKCDSCDNRTKTQEYTEKVDGIK